VTGYKADDKIMKRLNELYNNLNHRTNEKLYRRIVTNVKIKDTKKLNEIENVKELKLVDIDEIDDTQGKGHIYAGSAYEKYYKDTPTPTLKTPTPILNFCALHDIKYIIMIGPQISASEENKIDIAFGIPKNRELYRYNIYEEATLGSEPIDPKNTHGVVHIAHYEDWKGVSTPDMKTFKKWRTYLNDLVKDNKNVLVHCSAGLGRTGVLLVYHFITSDLDSGTTTIKTYDDIQTTVRKKIEYLRLRKRPGLVQTYRQYKFICDVLAVDCNIAIPHLFNEEMYNYFAGYTSEKPKPCNKYITEKKLTKYHQYTFGKPDGVIEENSNTVPANNKKPPADNKKPPANNKKPPVRTINHVTYFNAIVDTILEQLARMLKDGIGYWDIKTQNILYRREKSNGSPIIVWTLGDLASIFDINGNTFALYTDRSAPSGRMQHLKEHTSMHKLVWMQCFVKIHKKLFNELHQTTPLHSIQLEDNDKSFVEYATKVPIQLYNNGDIFPTYRAEFPRETKPLGKWLSDKIDAALKNHGIELEA
jgi:protein-tyrosine phosphatase